MAGMLELHSPLKYIVRDDMSWRSFAMFEAGDAGGEVRCAACKEVCVGSKRCMALVYAIFSVVACKSPGKCGGMIYVLWLRGKRR
ncbi:hypothetical protein PanWU01x14_140810 [Parasponia andersonii]|uniref:Uncharacterized protein n=1 Tax=Parasponia andersonii TaxID=3476 RepID=A0A2P5CM16_PARAD|nr:hypothetical protein PanWU01x14_140810 [Parasponia andersonii]